MRLDIVILAQEARIMTLTFLPTETGRSHRNVPNKEII